MLDPLLLTTLKDLKEDEIYMSCNTHEMYTYFKCDKHDVVYSLSLDPKINKETKDKFCGIENYKCVKCHDVNFIVNDGLKKYVIASIFAPYFSQVKNNNDLNKCWGGVPIK